MSSLPPSLHSQITEDTLVRVITLFYENAFSDPMISHFFFRHDRIILTKQQIDFTRGLLGGPNHYSGKSLTAAHHKIPIAVPHFNRRQMLMREAMTLCGLSIELAEKWLAIEQSLQSQILGTNSSASCDDDTP